MPVPPATIVFAIATAIPFGLAIRDTASGKYDLADRFGDRDYDDDDRYGDGDLEVDEEALEEYGRQQQQLMAEKERLRIEARQEIEAARERVRGLYGPEIASMGPTLSSIQLDRPKSEVDAATLGLIGMGATLLDDGARTYMLYLDVGGSTECEELSFRLRDTWGPAQGTPLVKMWFNETTGHRAVLDEQRSCELKFENTVALADWLDRTKTAAVPMGALGGSLKALIAELGTRASVPEDGGNDGWISWTAPGTGAGTGPTTITAYTKGGKVVGLFASLTIDSSTQDAIIERVSKLTGKQPVNKDSDEPLVWKTSPAITVETGDTQLFLRIGEQGQ
jgi:hypothetical protein